MNKNNNYLNNNINLDNIQNVEVDQLQRDLSKFVGELQELKVKEAYNVEYSEPSPINWFGWSK